MCGLICYILRVFGFIYLILSDMVVGVDKSDTCV